eukprot:8371121-Alexandrium_andersonii.AAC.1
MSASLVGSEMCIRDSGSDARGNLAQGGGEARTARCYPRGGTCPSGGTRPPLELSLRHGPAVPSTHLPAGS